MPKLTCHTTSQHTMEKLGYLQQNWGLSIYFEAISNGMLSMLSWSKDPSWRREEKEGKIHRRMNRRYHRCIESEHLVHCATTGINLIPPDEPMVHFVDVPDELQRKSSEDSSTGWSDGLSEDTVGLSDAQFESRQRRAKTKSSAPDQPMHWSRGSVGLSDGRVESTRDVLAAGSSAPDEPTHRRCNASEQLCQRIFNG
jgi:hypothetical protein